MLAKASLMFLLCLATAVLTNAASYPTPVEGDFTISNFSFQDGSSLPELKLHFMTIGQPVKDAAGITRNAVLIMHGTGGTGQQFIRREFADALFGPGQLLDATKYFIIIPDGIGHGRCAAIRLK